MAARMFICAAPTSSTAPPPRTLRRWDRPPSGHSSSITDTLCTCTQGPNPDTRSGRRSRETLARCTVPGSRIREGPGRKAFLELKLDTAHGVPAGKAPQLSRPHLAGSTCDPVTDRVRGIQGRQRRDECLALVTTPLIGAGMRGATRVCACVDIVDIGEAQIQIRPQSAPGGGFYKFSPKARPSNRYINAQTKDDRVSKDGLAMAKQKSWSRNELRQHYKQVCPISLLEPRLACVSCS